jgi:hypothetical protein
MFQGLFRQPIHALRPIPVRGLLHIREKGATQVNRPALDSLQTPVPGVKGVHPCKMSLLAFLLWLADGCYPSE